MDLIYNKASGRYIVGVPARNLSADEVAALAEAEGITAEALADLLCRGGLYAKANERPSRKAAPEPETPPPDDTEEEKE